MLAVLLRGTLAEANLVLIYLLSVVVATVRYGRAPGILASVLAVLAFDLFLVKPIHSLYVADPQYLLTFAIMLAVSLIVSHLTANLRRQAMLARARARHSHAQFGLSRDLGSALAVEQIADIALKHLASAFRGSAAILIADRSGTLDCSPLNAVPGIGQGSASVMAQAIFKRERKGAAVDAVSTSGQLHLVALRAPMRVRGVLVMIGCECGAPEQERLLQAFAAQIALAIERVHYVNVASETEVAMASERLRNSLLSAVSHDIRTPLAAIVGLSSTLANTPALDSATRGELARAIQDDAVRMNDLVTNLLDMARLQTGAIHLHREWQLIEEVFGSALAASARAIGDMQVTLSLPADLPLVEYDAVLLERVLCNLIENAARHASQGGWIGIAAGTQHGELRICVSDRGPGVARGDAERIFNKFVHGGALPSHEGVRLGLAICRTIVEAHGGAIWADAHAQGGASFIFSLPLGSPPQLPGLDPEEHS